MSKDKNKEQKKNKNKDKSKKKNTDTKLRNKKIILTIIAVILFIIVIFLGYLVFRKYILKKNFEDDILGFANKNQSTIFTINNITLFSSADAGYKTNTANNFTIQNLYQYTDIAIFIRNTASENTLENTLKKVTIDNISFTTKPNLGEPKLYFKSLNNFAKSDIIEENLISDSFEFNVSSSDEADLNTPTLYNNLANPLTFSYVNTNIKPDYTITDVSSPITYDGSLLKKCNINLEDINSTISFDINITNNLDQNFRTNVSINIPLSSADKSIYDGNLTLKNDTTYNFYRYN